MPSVGNLSHASAEVVGVLCGLLAILFNRLVSWSIGVSTVSMPSAQSLCVRSMPKDSH